MRDDDVADTLGEGGVYFDPLWRISVTLTDLEQELLHTWWVRRLAFITHAGGASITTTQSYSRLEHSLGVLALVAHFEPDNHNARAAALLHDIGHLAFSHTLEGLAGLDHHTIGRQRIESLDSLLRDHATTAAEITALAEGQIASPLQSTTGGLKLDHLDSFLRSGQAHGRTTTPPQTMLGRLRLLGGAIDTDERTAAELTRLIVAEAHAQRSSPNIAAVAVLRHLVGLLATDRTPDEGAWLAALTDDELWAALLADERTADRTREFRQHPESWKAQLGVDDASALHHTLRRSYLDLATVEGEVWTSAEVRNLEAALPLTFSVTRITDSDTDTDSQSLTRGASEGATHVIRRTDARTGGPRVG
jgi:HD superfamily phosphohydrolase